MFGESTATTGIQGKEYLRLASSWKLKPNVPSTPDPPEIESLPVLISVLSLYTLNAT